MSYSQYSGNPYQQGPSQESGYGYGNPYGQQVSPARDVYLSIYPYIHLCGWMVRMKRECSV